MPSPTADPAEPAVATPAETGLAAEEAARRLQRVGGHNAEGQPVPAWDFSEPTAAAGALTLSAAQLARFGQAALGQFEHALRPAFELALKVHSPLGPQPGLQMGLGWILGEQGGRRLATHDGATFGFTSSLWLDLGGQRGGLVLSNAAFNFADIARHLMDERLPLRDLAAEKNAAKTINAQAEVALSPAQLAPLAGDYAASPQFKLSVRAREGRLFAQATGQPEFELHAAAPRRFFARVSPLQVEFNGDSGTPAQLVIEQGGRKTVFRREGEEAPPLVLPPQSVQALAGVYALNPGFKLRLRAEGSRLFARATGQGEFELFAQGPREFEARVAPIVIRFEAGDPPPALALQQAGQTSRFVRE